MEKTNMQTGKLEEQTKNSEQELRLEEALEQLDQTIAALQSRDIPLEQAYAAYENGMRLVKLCSEKIDLVEKKVLQISEEGEIREFL